MTLQEMTGMNIWGKWNNFFLPTTAVAGKKKSILLSACGGKAYLLFYYVCVLNYNILHRYYTYINIGIYNYI